MRTRHTHFSTLAKTRAVVLFAAIVGLLRLRDVITLTEVSNDRDVARLKKIPGWGFVQIEGDSGTDECALLYRKSKWRLVWAKTSLLSDRGVPRRGGAKVRSLDTCLEDRKSGQWHLWSTAHLPSGSEGIKGFTPGEQGQIARECVDAWAMRAQVWRRSPRFAAVHLPADWNLSFRQPWVRELIDNKFPGFTATWQSRLPARGTHGTRPIDFTLTTARIVRASVLPKLPLFDHRPYAETLETTVRRLFPSITWRVIFRARRRGVSVLTRRQWGAKHQATYAWRRKHKPHALLPGKPADTMVQHITVTLDHGPLTGDFIKDVQTVERIGFERFGSGISYNWVVDMATGQVAQGMPLDAKGTHTVNDKNVPGYSKDQNAVALAIACLGMPGTPLSAKAKNAITQLLVAHIKAGALTPTFDYDPHSKFAFKDCPCAATRDEMSDIRADALRLAR